MALFKQKDFQQADKQKRYIFCLCCILSKLVGATKGVFAKSKMHFHPLHKPFLFLTPV